MYINRLSISCYLHVFFIFLLLFVFNLFFLKVWNADTGECKYILQGHTSTVRCVAMHDTTGETFITFSDTY